MGGLDCYCIICGGPFCESSETEDEYLEVWDEDGEPLKFEGDFSWLSNISIITSDGDKIKTDYKTYDDYGSFVIDGKGYVCGSLKWMDGDERIGFIKAIVCHDMCHKLVKDTFNYDIKYMDVEPYIDNCKHTINLHKDEPMYIDEDTHKRKKIGNTFSFMLTLDELSWHDSNDFYLEMKNYMDQYYNLLGICTQEKWLLHINNPRNMERIKAMWSSLIYKIKYNTVGSKRFKVHRESPELSTLP